MKRRAQIWQDRYGTVHLKAHDDDEPGEVTRAFHVYGDYVYEWNRRDPGSPGRQVCERLSLVGSTLTCRHQADLLALIRREWRRGQDWLRRREDA